MPNTRIIRQNATFRRRKVPRVLRNYIIDFKADDSRGAHILIRPARSIRIRRLGMFGRKFSFRRFDRAETNERTNERLGAPVSFRHESARRKGHGKNRQMSEMAEAPLRRTTSYPRQQLAAGYGYWPSLADRPVSCAPRRRCGILLRGQEEAVHVDEAVCCLGRRGSAGASQRRETGIRANVRPVGSKGSERGFPQERKRSPTTTVMLERPLGLWA